MLILLIAAKTNCPLGAIVGDYLISDVIEREADKENPKIPPVDLRPAQESLN